MPDENQISESVHSQLRSKRSAIAQLPEAKQDAIYSLTFERFIQPRLSKGGLTKEQLAQAKASYINSLKGQAGKPLDFDPKREGSFMESAGGTFAGVGGGIAGAVAGGTRALASGLTGSEGLTGVGEALVRPMERFAERGREASEFGSGKTNAAVAEFTGKMIPGVMGAEAALPALELGTSSAGLGTVLEGAEASGITGARVAKAGISGAGFDIGSGDNTSGRNVVGYAAFDLMSRPIGRLLAKAGGRYGSVIHDLVRGSVDSRRTVGKSEVVEVGKATAEKAESKLVTRLAELFPAKAERVKNGEALENVYTPEDINKALAKEKKPKAPKVEAKVEPTAPSQQVEEKKTEAQARSVVEQNPATQGTVAVVEELNGKSFGEELREDQRVKAQQLASRSGAEPDIETLIRGSSPEAKSMSEEIKEAEQKTKDEAEQKRQAWEKSEREKREGFEYKINWDRYKDKGAEGVRLARSNAQHEVTIQAKEAADTIRSSPTMSAEEKQKALQNIGDRAKHTLYKIKTEKVPEGFVSAKTRDAERKASEYASQTSTKTKEAGEATQRAVATHAQEDPLIAAIDRSKELESTYKAKGRGTLYNAIVKAWTKQGHGDIGKLNEMLSVALSKVGEN